MPEAKTHSTSNHPKTLSPQQQNHLVDASQLAENLRGARANTDVSSTYATDECVIEGRLLMPDDGTPHVAVVVQAVLQPTADSQGPEVVATTLSNEAGKYRFADLKLGRYQLRCYTLNGWVYYQNGVTLGLEPAKSLEHIDFHFVAFKKG